MKVAFTYWPSLTNSSGKRYTTTWAKLLERLAEPRISADKHAVPGFSLATFAGDKRGLANVERVFAVGLDLDEGVDLDTLRPTFKATTSFVHTTWSSTWAAPRCRVFLLLSRPVTAEEYRRVYRACVDVCEGGGLIVDRAASDPSRLWFLPSVPREGHPFVYWADDGAPINVDAALAAVPPPPPPLPPVAPRPLASGGPSAFDRARAYVAKADPAISGSGGRTVTFMLAQRLIHGFELSIADAFALMADWNQRCTPPWSERDLRTKCEEAAKVGRFRRGDLVHQERAR